jgi:hypothetical protein
MNEFDKWLKNLKKLGPQESPVLIVNSKCIKEYSEIVNQIYSVYPHWIKHFTHNKFPEDGSIGSTNIIIFVNYTEPFTSELGNKLFDICKSNVIIFLQDEIENFDPEFLENYCTVYSP